MVVGKLHFFDALDPDFFAYGSFPLYVLKAIAQASDALFQTHFDNYDGLLVLGRAISSVLDCVTALLVFLIAKKISRRRLVALLAFAAYTLFFFPIQNSNFFIVDVFVTTLLSASFLSLITYMEKPKVQKAIVTGILFGLLLACKITPIILAPAFFLIILVQPLVLSKIHQHVVQTILHRITEKLTAVPSRILRRKQPLTKNFTPFIFGIAAASVFAGFLALFVFLGMPYTFLHFPQFLKEISAQLRMNSDAYIFPYTLQYVDTMPYWYYLKQIFLWGVGPILAIVSLIGFGSLSMRFMKRLKRKQFLKTFTHPLFVYLCCNLLYFLVIGRSAVKFMRYMLPLYPAIALLASIGLVAIMGYTKLRLLRFVIPIVLLGSALLWTLSFVSIYLRPHTRIAASDWMLEHINANAVLAEEHWDDRLPLYGGERFQYVELPLYELPDDDAKWQMVNARLSSADYIVMTSNRLYGSLPKLANCTTHQKCYPYTARYYQDLFASRLGFTKVAEFTNRPSLLGFEINDDGADESFTVYDHPKVLIYKNSSHP